MYQNYYDNFLKKVLIYLAKVIYSIQNMLEIAQMDIQNLASKEGVPEYPSQIKTLNAVKFSARIKNVFKKQR